MEQLRVEYLKMRRLHSWNLDWFYRYYLYEYDRLAESKKYRHRLNKIEFLNIIQPIFNFNNLVIINYLDCVFGVTVLQDTKGNNILII